LNPREKKRKKEYILRDALVAWNKDLHVWLVQAENLVLHYQYIKP